jgi:hypothetical protein
MQPIQLEWADIIIMPFIVEIKVIDYTNWSAPLVHALSPYFKLIFRFSSQENKAHCMQILQF